MVSIPLILPSVTDPPDWLSREQWLCRAGEVVVRPVESEAELPPACLEVGGGGLQAASSRHAPYEQSGENRFSACLEEPAKAQSRDHKY